MRKTPLRPPLVRGEKGHTLIFTGDCLPDRPFSLPPWIPGGCAVGNLEAVISRESHESSRKAYAVRLGPEAVHHLRESGLSAFNVANNHVYDSGAAAFDEMLELLEDQPDFQIYGTRQKPFAEFVLEGRRIAVIGCLEPCRSRGPRLFREEDVESLIRDLGNRYSRIFVTPHWAKEGEFAHHPSPTQRFLARRWAQAGAAGVFGHHTHTLHGREKLSGMPVYYSLGNFAFDHEEGNRYPATALKLVVEYDGKSEEFKEHLYVQRGPAAPRRASAMEQGFFETICWDLTDWSGLRWARTVGPIYIPKSAASWKLRFEKDPARTLLLSTVWSLLPKTLLLRWGASFPDARWMERHAAFSLAIERSS